MFDIRRLNSELIGLLLLDAYSKIPNLKFLFLYAHTSSHIVVSFAKLLRKKQLVLLKN